jgi:transcriptional regulator with XRE-family HTH domain
VDKNKKTKTLIDQPYRILMKRVALNVRRARESRKLTQEDMIEYGFERRWFQRIESGTYSVSLPTLEKVARALKVDISELFKK